VGVGAKLSEVSESWAKLSDVSESWCNLGTRSLAPRSRNPGKKGRSPYGERPFFAPKRICGLGAGIVLGALAEIGRHPRARSNRQAGSAERRRMAPRNGSGDVRAAAPGIKAAVPDAPNFKFGKFYQVFGASGTDWQ
jgi:hypothetical protein